MRLRLNYLIVTLFLLFGCTVVSDRRLASIEKYVPSEREKDVGSELKGRMPIISCSHFYTFLGKKRKGLSVNLFSIGIYSTTHYYLEIKDERNDSVYYQFADPNEKMSIMKLESINNGHDFFGELRKIQGRNEYLLTLQREGYFLYKDVKVLCDEKG